MTQSASYREEFAESTAGREQSGALGVHEQTVRKHIKAFPAKGFAGLADQPISGRTPRANAAGPAVLYPLNVPRRHERMGLLCILLSLSYPRRPHYAGLIADGQVPSSRLYWRR